MSISFFTKTSPDRRHLGPVENRPILKEINWYDDSRDMAAVVSCDGPHELIHASDMWTFPISCDPNLRQQLHSLNGRQFHFALS